MATLRLEGVGKTFAGGTRAVDAVSLDVGEGELVVLAGPSGCGKSTLLRLIAGLDEPTEGRVLLGGVDLVRTPPGRRNVAMVFQNYALYPHKTVHENIAFALHMRGMPRAEVDRLVRQTAEKLGLCELLPRYPAQLSGGQQQRVALGRALVRRPGLFLFDEPLSNLDMNLRRGIRQEIKRLQRESATAAVYVTHDQEEAMSLGDRLVVMRAGRVLQVGTPAEVYAKPANRFVAEFFGSPPMNFLDGVVAERGDRLVWEGQSVASPWPLADAHVAALKGQIGQQVTLGFRPDTVKSVSLNGESALSLSLQACALEQLGEHVDVLLVTEAGERLTARLRGSCEVTEGSQVEISIPPEALHWFQAGPEGARLA